MKALLLLAAAVGSLSLSTGCARIYRIDSVDNDFGAPPAYSSNERYQQIDRNWAYEGKQAIDDFDHLLLLRPASRMTIWSVR